MFGQTETNGELYDICKISVYEESYIKFEISGLGVTFKTSEDTANYLKGFFQPEDK